MATVAATEPDLGRFNDDNSGFHSSHSVAR